MRNLILLHGALGHSDHFIPYETSLSSHFKVHKILFDGHGESTLPEKDLTIEHYVDQVHHYCNQHQLEQVDLFGYSMGGYVALYYALQYPERVSSILTLATKLSWTEDGALKESKLLHPETLSQKVPVYAAQLAAIHGAQKWEQLLPAIAGLMIRLGKKPLLQEHNLSGIQVPVQLMVGDKDNMTNIEETRDAVKCIPNARIAVLPGTKHPLEQVRPKLLTNLMSDFWEI